MFDLGASVASPTAVARQRGGGFAVVRYLGGVARWLRAVLGGGERRT